jgi:uncharacterized caspase-like protein
VRKVAFLVANDTFPEDSSIPPLRFTQNDASELKEILDDPETCGFETKLYLNESSQKVLADLEQISDALEADDTLLFYYAGHGKLRKNGQLCLASKDTTMANLGARSIRARDVLNYLQESHARRRVLILDCCQSGAIGYEFRGDDLQSTLAGLARSFGSYILTASTAIQLAEEREKDGHGVFTKALIDCLRDGGKEILTVADWYEYAYRRLKGVANQTPLKWGLQEEGPSFEIGNFKAKLERERKREREQLISVARDKLRAYVDFGDLTEEQVEQVVALLKREAASISPRDRRFRDDIIRFTKGEATFLEVFGGGPYVMSGIPPRPPEDKADLPSSSPKASIIKPPLSTVAIPGPSSGGIREVEIMHTISDAYKKYFDVKSTHAKYIMGERSSELIKLRVIRASREVHQIKIDRVPTVIDKSDVAAEMLSEFEQDCVAMPGVALKRGEYYQVVLGDDQIFEANAEHVYLISIKLRAELDVLHNNPDEDFIHIVGPLGREKLVAEVHFPPTRKLKRVKNKVQLVVSEVSGSDSKEIDSTKFIVNAEDPIQPVLGTITDMFRLTLPDPPQDADIRIMWQWSKVKVAKAIADPLKVFISYSHQDEKKLERLGEHLQPLVINGLMGIWKDREIEAGADWEGEINKEIEEADIILLLVSPSFIASPYCRKELLRAIEQRDARKAVPVPIILESCDWISVFNRPEYKPQALPRDNKPVAGGGWRNQNVAYTTIAKELRTMIQRMLSKS